ncbi:kinesin-like nuclear fusion protein [Coemansia sp. RSA 989]|nr:kinesin-like nuclear fusion protein [Coemansia sp. RSA 1086]KAJ1748498.1 kinesin-like nuclear fusion protein [Coemansia sp. RSA 1821]KAJ1862664.1 kinesin-like nuclear fusion protein [Coemansia sp. RSA 989]KAJ2668218.1 kinesin-like nuclear fusion protein [Coemansia sp. RSA 1085]
MGTGIPQPASMLRAPSKIAAPVKRKLTEESSPIKAPNDSTNPAAKRQIKAPVSKVGGTAERTVHAGRRSSQGFKVAAKPAGAPQPGAAGTRQAGPRPAPRAGAARRIPPSRTSVTQGRQPGARGTARARAVQSSLAPPGSIKRRRVDGPTGMQSGSPSIGGASALPQPAATGAESTSGLLGGEESDDDGLGPQPSVKDRPESDVQGRLRDLERLTAYMIEKTRTAKKAKNQLRVELDNNSTHVAQLELEKGMLTAKVEAAERQVSELQADKRKCETEMEDAERRHRSRVSQLQDEQHQLQKAVSRLREELDTASAGLKSKREECVRLEATVSKQASDQVELESSCRGLRAKVEQLENVVSEREIRIAELEDDVALRCHTIEELEAKLRKEETLRRGLHNTIQELKGNIRVFCRVRPLHGEEEAEGKAPITLPACEDSNQIELTQTSENALGRATAKTFPFKFDRVFSPESTQDAVFDEVSQLIQSALDGYPVCIFAYGQTGSGKTHTMQGPDSISSQDMDRPDLGIIPRAVRQIYETTSSLAQRGWEYSLEGQFLEIYNETIQDLLAPSARSAQANGKQPKLDIYQDSQGHTRVKNVTTVSVDSAERVHWLLARAAENRTVAATNCNERSSRSHSVFTLYLQGKNRLTGESSSGVLNLIDLAGSERLSSSGSSGDRLKETQAINKSLACLGDVIAALAKGNRHIPYRNSKLTHLLQESLGAGNSKTLMFVCVNPSPASTQESLCSLQFATKVNSCQIGTAKRQAAS